MKVKMARDPRKCLVDKEALRYALRTMSQDSSTLFEVQNLEVTDGKECSATRYSFALLSFALSYLLPSSACSLTERSGSSAGIIRLGEDPGTSEYLEKSVTPTCLLRKSSSSSSCPLTTEEGAFSISRIASEKMVALRKSRASSGLFLTNCSVAADSMA